MGTRHLTGVKKNGEWKIAQYGQWDGYPTGQGFIVLDFLKSMDLAKFENRISQLHELTKEEEEKVNADTNWENNYSYLCRDMGARILQYVYENDLPTGVVLEPDFMKDSLFCEWAYVVDLDDKTLKVYTDGDDLIATYPLNELPDYREMAKLEFGDDEEGWKEYCHKYLDDSDESVEEDDSDDTGNDEDIPF